MPAIGRFLMKPHCSIRETEQTRISPIVAGNSPKARRSSTRAQTPSKAATKENLEDYRRSPEIPHVDLQLGNKLITWLVSGTRSYTSKTREVICIVSHPDDDSSHANPRRIVGSVRSGRHTPLIVL